jgi:light-regulated signal transduction histidine kinase (bacteriophytochrome)
VENALAVVAGSLAAALAGALLWVARVRAEQARDLEALRLQREELARKNEDLRLFFFAASHDLRQPIRQVLGFARLLEKRHGEAMADEGREYVRFIEEVSGRMEGLLDGLLAYASLGTQALELEPVDLNQALAQARLDLALDLQAAGAGVEAQPLPTVRGQGPLLADVFKNLLDNCVKYRDPSRTLEIKIGAEKEGAGWKLSVKDNGVGVPPERQEGLFKVFQRGHLSAHYPGFGIGLAYCRRVVELHGGWIRLSSQEGRGVTVEFYLPEEPPRQTLADGSGAIVH